jgi:hypothetical protein
VYIVAQVRPGHELIGYYEHQHEAVRAMTRASERREGSRIAYGRIGEPDAKGRRKVKMLGRAGEGMAEGVELS